MDQLVTTVICDPEAQQFNLEAGESTIYCDDSVLVGLRALRTATDAPINRLYFRRTLPCLTIPCTEDELSEATVTGWSDAGAISVALDSRLTTVGTPVADPSALWPVGGGSPPADIAKPKLAHAPRELRTRKAYPFCGEALVGQPPTITRCFRDAVLAGRPAEMINHGNSGIEELYRFDGSGAIHEYGTDGTAWNHSDGSLILGITPNTWDYEPWAGTATTL